MRHQIKAFVLIALVAMGLPVALVAQLGRLNFDEPVADDDGVFGTADLGQFLLCLLDGRQLFSLLRHARPPRCRHIRHQCHHRVRT